MMEWRNAGRMAEQRKGGMLAEWRNGGTGNGGTAEWQNRHRGIIVKFSEWRNGRMAERKNGTTAKWQNGRTTERQNAPESQPDKYSSTPIIYHVFSCQIK